MLVMVGLMVEMEVQSWSFVGVGGETGQHWKLVGMVVLFMAARELARVAWK
jgi:hypothetical protein